MELEQGTPLPFARKVAFIPAKLTTSIMAGLDPAKRGIQIIVIPANAGIQLRLIVACKLDPGFRRGDE